MDEDSDVEKGVIDGSLKDSQPSGGPYFLRLTKEEMEGLWNAAFDDKKVSEALVVNFTSLDSAALILSKDSHGLRASNVGQGGGGLSVVCDSHDCNVLILKIFLFSNPGISDN